LPNDKGANKGRKLASLFARDGGADSVQAMALLLRARCTDGVSTDLPCRASGCRFGLEGFVTKPGCGK
jgi:hypothetical protein